MRTASLLLAFLAAPLGPGATAPQAASPLWGGLEPGSFAVGFRSSWRLDRARRYDASALAPGAPAVGPRPLLVNAWYPAQVDAEREPMRHGDYFAIESDAPELAAYSRALANYARGVCAQETAGAAIDALDERGRARFEALLATPTASRRGAPPAEGRFPIVVYHAGYGSSFEDDAVLCEYLASHGYLVLGSAFPAADGSSFNIDGRNGSVADCEELVRSACEGPSADASHVAVIGHSGGAHFALRWAARAGNPLDAVVSLDTTQDYYGLGDPRWDHPAEALRSVGAVRMPLLVVANPHAWFSLCDRLVESERVYLTLATPSHNEFIAQGVLAAESAARAGEPDAEKRSDAVRTAYDALDRWVLAFLDAKLKGEGGALTAAFGRAERAPLGGPEPHAERMPRGAGEPPPFDPDAGPIAPRQVRAFLAANGVEETRGMLELLAEEHPDAPVFDDAFGFSLLHDLVEAGREDDARALAPLYARLCPGLPGFYRWVADNYREKPEMRAFVRRCLIAASLLTPDDAELRARLDALPADPPR